MDNIIVEMDHTIYANMKTIQFVVWMARAKGVCENTGYFKKFIETQ